MSTKFRSFASLFASEQGDVSIILKLQELERELRLLRYLDDVGQPDYALWSAGGRIVSELTSPTYTTSWWMRPWKSQLPDQRPPELAITPDIQAGCCWPMQGDHGSLGIRLAEELVPRAITIDHLALQLAFRNNTAPKEVSVWGIQPQGQHRDTGALRVQKGLHLSFEYGLLDLHPDYYHRDFVSLGNFTYDIHTVHPIQTFNLVEEAEKLDLIMEILLFIFESNWGNDHYTCIYRVRVHGNSRGE